MQNSAIKKTSPKQKFFVLLFAPYHFVDEIPNERSYPFPINVYHYLINGIVVDLGNGISDEERATLQLLLDRYEAAATGKTVVSSQQ